MARSISSKRRKQIARSAQKAAKKQKAKHGRPRTSLKIQTATPGKRITIALSSLIFLGLAAYLQEESFVIAAIFGLIFLFVLGVAIVGDRKTIDGAINGLDAGVSDTALDGIIDSIF